MCWLLGLSAACDGLGAVFTNLAVCPACGHTVSLHVCPGNKSNCNALTHGDMVSLDEGRFPTLELNNRRLSVKNSFCRKNGVYTRSALGILSFQPAGGSDQIPEADWLCLNRLPSFGSNCYLKS